YAVYPIRPATAKRHCRSIFGDTRAKQAKFLEIYIGQRVLVLGQFVQIGRRLRNGEIRGHSRREKARALQFLKAGQIPNLLQGEMIEEFFRSAVSYRASWRFAPAPHLHPLRFKQRVQRTLGGLDPSNVLDLRTRDG